MDAADAAKDWLAHRDRFCAETRAAVEALAAELRRPAALRDIAAANRCLARLARLRRTLDALLRERGVILGARDYRRVSIRLRRDLEDASPFGADPARLLAVWNRVSGAARQALSFEPMDLAPPARPELDPEEQMWRALEAAMVGMAHFVNPREAQAAEARARGYYSDIPLPARTFLADCHAALRVARAQGRREPMRFLDVGCGGGVKVAMAMHVFGEAWGLEVDPGYHARAERFLAEAGQGRCHVLKGDALEFDGYDRFDVIYFYQPIAEEGLLIELERRIAHRCAPGTVLIAPYFGFATRAEGLGCGHVTDHVWIARTTAEAAAETARRARTMGTVIAALPSQQRAYCGLLAPLAEALEENGFGLV